MDTTCPTRYMEGSVEPADLGALRGLEARLDDHVRQHYRAAGCFMRLCGRSAKDAAPLSKARPGLIGRTASLSDHNSDEVLSDSGRGAARQGARPPAVPDRAARRREGVRPAPGAAGGAHGRGGAGAGHALLQRRGRAPLADPCLRPSASYSPIVWRVAWRAVWETGLLLLPLPERLTFSYHPEGCMEGCVRG